MGENDTVGGPKIEYREVRADVDFGFWQGLRFGFGFAFGMFLFGMIIFIIVGGFSLQILSNMF